MDKNKILGVTRTVTPSTLWLVVLTMVGLLVLISGRPTEPAEPPEGAVTADIGFPPVGTQFEFKTVTEGQTRRQIFTVLEEGTYKGKPVFRTTDGVVTPVYDKATRSWRATLREGKMVREASPHSGRLSSPLWVGKSWVTYFTFTRRKRRETISRDVVRGCKVAAYEEVKVPAGTFKVFRVECSTFGSATTLWYSAELNITVKRIFERLHPIEEAFPRPTIDFWKSTKELLEYRAR